MPPLQQVRGLGRRRKRSLGIQDIPDLMHHDSGSLDSLQHMGEALRSYPTNIVVAAQL